MENRDELKEQYIELITKRDEERKINDLRKILSLPEGRRFLWNLWAECKVFGASFSQDTHQTAFNEGKRDIGIFVLNLANTADVEKVRQLQVEAVAEQKQRNKEFDKWVKKQMDNQ